MERQYIVFRSGRALTVLGIGYLLAAIALAMAVAYGPNQRLLHYLVIAVGCIVAMWAAVRADRGTVVAKDDRDKRSNNEVAGDAPDKDETMI